ncbi:MAG: RNA polymerase sigma factor [Thermomonas sp.]
MNTTLKDTAPDYAAMDDGALVALVQGGDRGAFRQIMQRCNQRLYRVVRGVVDNDAEAEDVVQEAYVHAFEKIDSFRGEASIATWLTRIALNEAYGRLRKRRHMVEIEHIDALAQMPGKVVMFPNQFGGEDPAAAAARQQLRHMLECAVDGLPESFRIVFVLREIEGCTVEETASALDIRPETVKTRLHRARRLLRKALHDNVSTALTDAFPFLGPRCQRMTESVMARIDLDAVPASP